MDLQRQVELMGPRGLNPDSSIEERREIGRSPAYAPFREQATVAARQRVHRMHQQAAVIGRQNQQMETKAVNGLGEWAARIPTEIMMMVEKMEEADGLPNCWAQPGFLDKFLSDNPAFRVRTSRGTRGQEYAGTRFARRQGVDLRNANFGPLPLASRIRNAECGMRNAEPKATPCP